MKVAQLAAEARDASRRLAVADGARKNEALRTVGSLLRQQRAALQQENAKDLEAARDRGLPAAMIDRLTLSDRVIDSMADGLDEVCALPDPVGEITRMWTRPNGLRVGRMRIPLGVVGMIYEARPNVTVDAGALCLKSGNAALLRGGSEAIHSNRALAAVMQQGLAAAGLPAAAVQLVPVTDRAAVTEMLQLQELIDVIIPRGGESLIRMVYEQSRIPVIAHYKGVCHVYIDAGAEPQMAADIALNAKTQRPGVCNAMETLLMHADFAQRHGAALLGRLHAAGVELRGCARCRALLDTILPATDADWSAEYLDLVLSVRIVDSLSEAIAHIAQFGSRHTETIVTPSYAAAQRFVAAVDSSAVLVNASTRFNDGNQLGLGAEIGISTSKIHAFGPMGLEELTTTKFIVFGSGQVRT